MSRFEAEVTIRRRRYANEATGWAVMGATETGGGELVLVGNIAHLEERERVQVSGEWVVDPRYGEQVKVGEAHPLPPADPAALLAYLRRVRHVGAKRATQLIDRHGPGRVIEVIDEDPARVFGEVGLTGRRAAEAATAWAELRVLRRLHLLLAPHGLGYLVARIGEHFGPEAHRRVSEDPYSLTSMFGVGFAVADRIARGLPQPANEARPAAALLHVLAEAERSGSTCLPAPRALAAAGQLLGHPPPQDLVGRMIGDELLSDAAGYLYRRPTAELEAELAARVAELAGSEPALKEPRGDRAASSAAGAGGLTREQVAAVESAFRHRLSLVTGGPGTGKTSTIRAIVAAAATRGAKVLLLAPTGRAATRMTESSGTRASTAHSALGWIPGEGPTHDEDDPLRCDLLILDESSMANLELMVMLLRAVGEGTHVVLVGDADQLAPVGAGKPFAELIESGRVATTRLTHIFRQAAGSMIVLAAHAVRQGQVPNFRPPPEARRDLFLLERRDPLAARAEIVELVAHRLPRHYAIDPVADIQVFAPVYKGELGIDALNEALRGELNPDGRPVRGGRLRIGDKLMMTGRNLHELGLMNGTVLRLLDEVEGEEESSLLLSADGTPFRLPVAEAERLRLAYACSVHRGQGIELPVAVIVAHPAAGAYFLRREMLYTAITRARLATVIVGTTDTLDQAVRSTDTGRRHGRLAERLSELEQPVVTAS